MASELSNDVWRHVVTFLSFLPSKELGCTCKLLNTVVFEESHNLFERIKIHPDVTAATFSKLMSKIAPAVLHLDISNCKELNGQEYLVVLRESRLLETLDLRGVPNLDAKFAVPILEDLVVHHRLRRIKHVRDEIPQLGQVVQLADRLRFKEHDISCLGCKGESTTVKMCTSCHRDFAYCDRHLGDASHILSVCQSCQHVVCAMCTSHGKAGRKCYYCRSCGFCRKEWRKCRDCLKICSKECYTTCFSCHKMHTVCPCKGYDIRGEPKPCAGCQWVSDMFRYSYGIA